MKLHWIFAIGIIALFFVGGARPAHAAMLTGLQLREYCGLIKRDSSTMTSTEIEHGEMCLIFITAIEEGYELGMPKDKRLICIPTDPVVPNGELGLIVFKYLDEHPEELHNDPGYLVLDALHTAFPCKFIPPSKK